MERTVSSPAASGLDGLEALPTDERRATLAAWLSDANAVPDAPGLRRIDGGAVVPVDMLLEALRKLDGPAPDATPPAGQLRWRTAFGRRRRAQGGLKVLIGRRQRDDDDDPPPCPAVAGWPIAPAGLGVAV